MENLKINIENIEQTSKLADNFAKAVEGYGGLVCLYGDIGAGKTTFVRFLGKVLGVEEKITSPSFVILNEYHSGKIPLYHFDLYRLEREGLESIIDELHDYTENDNALALIEWAEFSSGDLPESRLDIQIQYVDDNKRVFVFTPYGEKFEKIVQKLSLFL